MDEQSRQCVMYVDYEGLLTDLSHFQLLDIDPILIQLLAQVRQRFQIQRAVVIGDWNYHRSSRSQLEACGFLCRSLSAPVTDIGQILHSGIIEQLNANEAAEVYILVSGHADYSPLLKTLQQTNRQSILWTLLQPSPTDQALCSEWNIIALPQTLEKFSWPRQVMLQAIALVADHLGNGTETPFLLSRLQDHLNKREIFNDRTNTWLAIVTSEQLILPQRPGDSFLSSYVYLNRQHTIVQKALLIRERILCTLSAMQANREWVAFSALEKALRSAKILTEDQRFRHLWLELLVAENVLIAGKTSQPDGPFQVTTLRLNPDHSMIAALPRFQHFNLVRLILIMSNFLRRKGHNWMAVSGLLKDLTGDTTRVEARATLDLAVQQGLVKLLYLPNPRHPAFPVSTLQLQEDHELVQEVLARRDQLICITDAALANPNEEVSEAVLIKAFITEGQLQKHEAVFWIRLFEGEGMLEVVQASPGLHDIIPLLCLNQQDPIVDQVLDQISKRA